MVRMGSSGPVGVMMNQKSMLTMLTSQIAWGVSARFGAECNGPTYRI